MTIKRRTLLTAGGLTAIGIPAGQASRAVAAGATVYNPEILVIGGGTGGTAAAIAALKSGRSVILTEPTGWIGGQLTVQGVPPDEHQWINSRLGATATYCNLRVEVRNAVKAAYPLTTAARNDLLLDPGNGWPPFCAEPRFWRDVLMKRLQPYLDSGKLRLFLLTEPTSATVSDRTVTSVTFDRQGGTPFVVRPQYVIDASELGDLLPIAGIPYVVGREKGTGTGGTGELHNPYILANPLSQQCFTRVAAVGWTPSTRGTPVTTPAYDSYAAVYRTFGTGEQRDVFDPSREWPWSEARNFWPYRRVRWRGHLARPPYNDISLLNQPENDHIGENLVPPTGRTDRNAYWAAFQRAGDRTKGLVQYFQTEYARPDGSGRGWPELTLVPHALGTASGIAAAPYIRESRRILAEFTIKEQHVGVENSGPNGPVRFADSVGTGAGPIDVHPDGTWEHGLAVETYPYQIPFSALVPRDWRNVLAGAKNIGTTHLTNGCYRFHPTEWSIGEAAGFACAFVLGRRLRLRQLLDNGPHFRAFATWLDGKGIRRSWPTDVAGTPAKMSWSA